MNHSIRPWHPLCNLFRLIQIPNFVSRNLGLFLHGWGRSYHHGRRGKNRDECLVNKEPGIRRCCLQSLSYCSHKHPGGQREEKAPFKHFNSFSEAGQHCKDLLLSPVRANREHTGGVSPVTPHSLVLSEGLPLCLRQPLPREHFLLLRQKWKGEEGCCSNYPLI